MFFHGINAPTDLLDLLVRFISSHIVTRDPYLPIDLYKGVEVHPYTDMVRYPTDRVTSVS